MGDKRGTEAAPGRAGQKRPDWARLGPPDAALWVWWPAASCGTQLDDLGLIPTAAAKREIRSVAIRIGRGVSAYTARDAAR
jgi:hypothetical protein